MARPQMLPPQIQRNIERANELQGLAPDGSPLAQGASPEPDGEEAVPQQVEEGTQEEPAVEPPSPPAPPAPEPPPTPPPSPPEVDWQAKYNSLQGKFNAGQHRLNELETQLAAVNARVAEMSRAPEPKIEETYDPEDLNTYGPQLLAVIDKRANAVAGKFKNYEREIALLREQMRQMSQTQTESKRDRLLRRLNETLDGWDRQDNDVGFQDWCHNTPHPDIPGMNYRKVLDAAVDAGDVERVTRVLFAYPRATVTRKGVLPTPPAPPARKDTGARPPADTAVMPPRGRATAPPDPHKGFVTLAELRAYTNAVTKGELRGEARNRVKQRIDAAIAEHRILPG